MTEAFSPYCGPAPMRETLLYSWNTDPFLLSALGFCALLLAIFHTRLRAPRLAWLALGGIVIAFVSPLCALTVALFSARAAHHILLVSIIAPALALSLPLARFRIPPSLSMMATAAAMVLWHIPGIYDAAWNSAAVYWIMQVAVLISATAFWYTVLAPGAPAEDMMGRAFLVAGLAGVMGFIGAILTFAPRALYPQHLTGTALWEMDILADQQLAGLVMWVPGFVPLIALAFMMLQKGWRQGFTA